VRWGTSGAAVPVAESGEGFQVPDRPLLSNGGIDACRFFGALGTVAFLSQPPTPTAGSLAPRSVRVREETLASPRHTLHLTLAPPAEARRRRGQAVESNVNPSSGSEMLAGPNKRASLGAL